MKEFYVWCFQPFTFTSTQVLIFGIILVIFGLYWYFHDRVFI